MLPYHVKFPQEMSLITVTLDSVWQQLFYFPEPKFTVYLRNLRWHHNRFQTLRRCYEGIFNSPTLKIWEIGLLVTCYIHADFQTCRICKLQN